MGGEGWRGEERGAPHGVERAAGNRSGQGTNPTRFWIIGDHNQCLVANFLSTVPALVYMEAPFCLPDEQKVVRL